MISSKSNHYPPALPVFRLPLISIANNDEDILSNNSAFQLFIILLLFIFYNKSFRSASAWLVALKSSYVTRYAPIVESLQKGFDCGFAWLGNKTRAAPWKGKGDTLRRTFYPAIYLFYSSSASLPTSLQQLFLFYYYLYVDYILECKRVVLTPSPVICTYFIIIKSDHQSVNQPGEWENELFCISLLPILSSPVRWGRGDNKMNK